MLNYYIFDKTCHQNFWLIFFLLPYLKSALRQKGVKDSVINEVLSEYEPDQEDIVNLAKKYLKNKPFDEKIKQ